MPQNQSKRMLAFALSGIVLAVLPFIVGSTLGNSWVRTLDFALLYIMLALGLNIVVGFAGLLDLGYIAFYAVGAYTFALLNSPHLSIFMPWWFILPLGAILAAFFGIMLGTPVLRLRGDYLAIVTLGFGEIIRIFMNNLNAPVNITNGPQGINMIKPIEVAGFSLGKPVELFGTTYNSVYIYYYLFLLLAVLTVIICHRLQHSRIGRAWVALREDDVAANAMGLNIRNIKLLAFAMGATFGGVAGAPQELLIAHFGSSTGQWMHRVAHGIDERPIVIESEPKSISRESTFERDLHARQDRGELSGIFTALCMRVADDLKRKGYACRTVGIKLRYADFRS